METSDSAVTAYTSLQPDQTIGPSHHRFKLISAGPTHPPGQLWSAQDVTTTTPVDVSLLIFDPRQFSEQSQLDRLRTTLNRTKTLKSPFIAPIYGQFFYRGLLFISLPPTRGITLFQLLESGKMAKLGDKQRIGIIKQLGHALHTVQMGRMNHGTLCPELIHLVPGRGVQLLGVGWYNALDAESTTLSYDQYQPEDHLIRGIASTSGDTYALARLAMHLLNRGKLDNTSRPPQLNDAQWNKLTELLNQRSEAELQAPLQLVRELFSSPENAEVVLDALELEKEPATAPSKAQEAAQTQPKPAPLSQPVPPPVTTVPSDSPTPARASGIAGLRLDLTALFNRPIFLVIGFLAGLMVSQIFNLVLRQDPPPEPVQSLTETQNPANPVNSVVTMADAKSPAINPFTPDNIAVMAQNHLTIFQHPTPAGTSAPQMISLPTGRFLMGDTQGVGDDNERPVREVRVAQRFALSRFEVTFNEYDQFATATARPLPDDMGWGRGQRPVINVSWEDAQAYAQWLSLQTGQPYRLPSEAEWEYAARAGTESAYWWGNALQPGMALCDDCEPLTATDRTAEVGTHPPNPWGLFDMNGNIDEWVADCYSDNYMGATTTQTARTSGGCDQRVMRGGSWFEISRLVRSSARYRHPPNAIRDSWGFRVAVDLN